MSIEGDGSEGINPRSCGNRRGRAYVHVADLPGGAFAGCARGGACVGWWLRLGVRFKRATGGPGGHGGYAGGIRVWPRLAPGLWLRARLGVGRGLCLSRIGRRGGPGRGLQFGLMAVLDAAFQFGSHPTYSSVGNNTRWPDGTVKYPWPGGIS